MKKICLVGNDEDALKSISTFMVKNGVQVDVKKYRNNPSFLDEVGSVILVTQFKSAFQAYETEFLNHPNVSSVLLLNPDFDEYEDLVVSVKQKIGQNVLVFVLDPSATLDGEGEAIETKNNNYSFEQLEYLRMNQLSFIQFIQLFSLEQVARFETGKSTMKTVDVTEKAKGIILYHLQCPSCNDVFIYRFDENIEKSIIEQQSCTNCKTSKLALTDEEMMGQYAHKLYLSGNVEQAINITRKALETLPESEELNRKLGKYYFANNQLNKAEYHLESAERINPCSSSINHDLAMVYEKIGNIPEAIKKIEKAIEINDESILLYSKAAFLVSNKSLNKARHLFEMGWSLKCSSNHQELKQFYGVYAAWCEVVGDLELLEEIICEYRSLGLVA